MAKLLPLLLILLLSFVGDLFAVPLATAMRVPLNQIDSKGNFTMAELIRRAARRSYNRVAALESKLANTTTSFNGYTPVKYVSYEYLMELSIGTPPVPLSSMMDTGSNLIWTQCEPCVRCFKQPTPVYNRTESSTFSQLGCTTPQCNDLSKYTTTNCAQSTCQYSYGYQDGSYTKVWISIGETLLKIPPSTFEINQDGSGGLFIDSGTSVTHLVEPAYSTLKQAVFDLVSLPRANRTFGVFDLCFMLPSSGQLPDMPDMTLHFDGADMRLQKENYMIEPESGLVCLAMTASRTFSILGNYQQQNMQILYNLESSTLSFEPAQCDVL
uniref:Peptidase A1 domain-containing protein n=1 Tax=Ananas comosus var. bracteatus TaxID=296719 RepID=A0A6V7NLP2_ANACO|nr:unnamed protein product [Ananas comosus var. bracteatus]